MLSEYEIIYTACPKCGHQSNNEHDHFKHMASLHWVCTKCNIQFLSEKTYNEHMEKKCKGLLRWFIVDLYVHVFGSAPTHIESICSFVFSLYMGVLHVICVTCCSKRDLRLLNISHSRVREIHRTRRKFRKMSGEGVLSCRTKCPASKNQGQCPANRCPAKSFISTKCPAKDCIFAGQNVQWGSNQFRVLCHSKFLGNTDCWLCINYSSSTRL